MKYKLYLCIIILALAIGLLPWSEGKTRIVPVNSCDFQYTDITTSIIQNILQSYPQSGAIIEDEPIKLNNRFFSINTRNQTSRHHYLYGLGLDGLWNTSDDKSYFISNVTEVPEMITESNNSYKYYWVSLVSGQNNIMSCDITPSGCINSSLVVAPISPTTGLVGILPSASQQRIYMAFSDNSSYSGDIYSCSFNPSSIDYCGNQQLSSYFNHSSFEVLGFPLQDEGFVLLPSGETNRTIEFFSIHTNSVFPLPLGSQPTIYNSAHIPGAMFTYSPFPSNGAVPVDILFIDLFNGFSATYSTLSQGTRPLLLSIKGNEIIASYTKSNPHRQIIKKIVGLNTPEIEIYVAQTPANAPSPFTIQEDLSLIASRQVGGQIHIYRSNCKG